MSKPRTQSTKKTNELEKLYQDQRFDHLQKPIRIGRGVILASLFLAIVFGLTAGFGGGLFVLITRTIPNPFGKAINLDEYLPSREITVQTQKQITVTVDERIAELSQKFENRIVKIFKANPLGHKARLLEQIYQPADALGLGAILTSDGWIISSGLQPTTYNLQPNLVVVGSDNKVYPVKQIITDPATDIVFLKIEGQGLSVVKLADESEVALGQEVLAYSSQGELVSSKISHLNWRNIKDTEDLIKSSDKFSSFIKLSNYSDQVAIVGSPVINLDDSVVGIVTLGAQGVESNDKQIVVIPTSQFGNLINQVLRWAKVSRPYLGIDYIDLSKAVGIIDPEFKDLKTGALVYGPPEKGSPAEAAGFKNRDVLLKVNKDPIDAYHSLTKLIHEYRPGDEVKLTVLREGKEEVVKVKLGELLQ